MAARLNLLDRAIGWVSPEAGVRRARARMALSYAAGRPKMGQKFWRAPATGPQAEIEPALETLRNRSRQMVRDNPYAARFVALLAAHQVGTGITARIGTPDAQALWDRWARRCDHDGVHDLGGLMALAARARAESGEVLLRLRVVSQAEARRRGLPREAPLTVQVMEADMLPIHTTLLPEPNRIIQGVEFAPDGTRLAYHLRRAHPGEGRVWTDGPNELERVPAEQVIHLFRVQRPGQVRGVPDMAPALLRMKQLDDFEDAALEQAKAQALLGVFLTGDPAMDTPADMVAANGTPTVELYPGMVHDLPPGKEPKFLQPTGAGAFEPFALHQLMAIAAGGGVTYDQLTGDLRQANYSSLRAGKIEFRRMVEQDQWLMFVPRLCEPLWRAFAALADIAGAFRAGMPDVEWQPPRFEMIDPGKEIDAAIASVRAGFETWDQVVASFGYDPERQVAEIARHNARVDEAGVILDSDPRRMARGGNANDAKQNAAVEIGATGAALPRQPAG